MELASLFMTAGVAIAYYIEFQRRNVAWALWLSRVFVVMFGFAVVNASLATDYNHLITIAQFNRNVTVQASESSLPSVIEFALISFWVVIGTIAWSFVATRTINQVFRNETTIEKISA